MIAAHKPQTVAATLARGTLLLAKTSTSPRADAQILLAHTLGRERGWLIAHGETFLSRAQAEKFVGLCGKRATGMPVAYITGFAGFYKREFAVNENVLIPRAETEHLVEDAIAFLQSKVTDDAPVRQLFTVFEAGIGSGAIACSLAAELPNAIVEGTDISLAAIKVAEYNARRLNVHTRCRFSYADIARMSDEKKYDVVVANLPYIPSAQVPRKPDPAGFEPAMALDGGADGLTQYRKLLEAAPRLLRSGGLLLIEAAPATIGALAALTQTAFPGAALEVKRDHAGIDRYVCVKPVKR
ncbi:MAG: peptide chain release factor N(5)-glutamine methyltransferase [Candidatus Baltobacteraceae bacterium]